MQPEVLRALFDHAPLAACLVAVDGAMLEANAAFAGLFALADSREARGLPVDQVLADPDAWRRAVREAAGGAAPAELQTAGRTRDGRALLLAVRLLGVEGSGEPRPVVAWFTDLTAYTLAPRTPVGARIVRSIGHDLGNMMMVIRGFAQVLPRELPEGGRGASWVAQIRAASDRAAALGEELLAAGRPPETEVAELAPMAALEALLPLVRRVAGPGVEVLVSRPAVDRTVHTNRDLLEATLLCLVSLARTDRPKDTQLHLEASWSEGDASRFVLRISGSDRGRCWEAGFPAEPPAS